MSGFMMSGFIMRTCPRCNRGGGTGLGPSAVGPCENGPGVGHSRGIRGEIGEDMNSLLRFFLGPVQGPASVLFIRFAVGLIFLTQGILKYSDPNMGVVRFARIGFPHPYFTAHFVGTFETVCGFLVLLGLLTRAAGRSAARRERDRDHHHQASRTLARQPGLLVHGERRAH